MLYNYHFFLVLTVLFTPKGNPISIKLSLPITTFPQDLVTTNRHFCISGFNISIFYIKGMIQYVTFGDWLLSLSITSSRMKSSMCGMYFTPLCGQPIFHCMTILPFIFPFISWWTFGGCLLLAVMNNAARNTCAQVFEHMFSVLLDMCLGVELLGHMLTLSNLLRNCQTVFQSGYTILHSH